MDVANSLGQQSQVPILLAELCLGAGYVLGEPLTMLKGNEAVVAPILHLYRYSDRFQVEPPGL